MAGGIHVAFNRLKRPGLIFVNGIPAKVCHINNPEIIAIIILHFSAYPELGECNIYAVRVFGPLVVKITGRA